MEITIRINVEPNGYRMISTRFGIAFWQLEFTQLNKPLIEFIPEFCHAHEHCSEA